MKNIVIADPVPEGYLFKDCSHEMLSSLPFAITRGPTQYLGENKKVVTGNEGKIYLPFVNISTVVEGINLKNLESKYEEYYRKMRKIRFNFLNKLRRKEGQGAYFLFLFMSQTVDSTPSNPKPVNAMLFIEKFSAVWADKIIRFDIDNLCTVHY
jgi:hypothetical protein